MREGVGIQFAWLSALNCGIYFSWVIAFPVGMTFSFVATVKVGSSEALALKPAVLLCGFFVCVFVLRAEKLFARLTPTFQNALHVNAEMFEMLIYLGGSMVGYLVCARVLWPLFHSLP